MRFSFSPFTSLINREKLCVNREKDRHQKSTIFSSLVFHRLRPVDFRASLCGKNLGHSDLEVKQTEVSELNFPSSQVKWPEFRRKRDEYEPLLSPDRYGPSSSLSKFASKS